MILCSGHVIVSIIQFCCAFLKPKGGKIYANITQPLRKLASKYVKFQWTEDSQKSFEELKELLVSDSDVLLQSRFSDQSIC